MQLILLWAEYMYFKINFANTCVYMRNYSSIQNNKPHSGYLFSHTAQCLSGSLTINWLLFRGSANVFKASLCSMGFICVFTCTFISHFY